MQAVIALGEGPGMAAMVIHATDVVVDDDGDPGFIVVGFDSEGPGSRRYLMLQRSYEFDEQDIALGMDRVYIERDSQAYSAYGGILRVELHRDRVLMSLDAATARKLGDEAEFEVRFDLEERRFEELRAGLTEVFKGFDCFASPAS